MSNPAGFDVKWNLTFSPSNNPTAHSRSRDPTQADYRQFKLFERSPSTSPNPSLESKPPTSPSLKRIPTTLDITAPAFAPKPVTTPGAFDPFNPDAGLGFHTDERTEEDTDAELSGHLLSAQLLDDFDADDVSTPRSHSTFDNGTTVATVAAAAPPTAAAAAATTTNSTAANHLPWSSSLNATSSCWSPVQSNATADNAVKSIWDNSNSVVHDSMWWDRFEPYSQEDEKEFDPTLQYYRGSLLDSDTIQDMNKLLLSVTNPSMEEQQAENVGEDMSALQMLESIFTDLGEAELTATLEEHGYDFGKATEALLNRKQPASSTTVSKPLQASPPSDTTQTPKRRQVCRHFLAGECYRKDCWFAHDLQVKVCKFWLQGSCLKGDYCEFSHHIDVQEMASKIKNHPQQQQQPQNAVPVRFDEREYPGLQSSKPKGSAVQPIHSPSLPKDQHPKLEQDDFPSLGAASKIKKPIKASPKPPAAINFAEVAKRKANVKQSGGAKGSPKRATSAQEARIVQRLKKPVDIPWLVTGSSLNQEYMKQREKAIQYGMLRNRFFSRATAFYMEGNGAKAKAYSNQAKYYNRLMQEMHTEASRRIFEQRNQHEAFVDLHGLHIDEALDIVHERLDKLRGYEGIVYIITGTGHHSGAAGYSHKKSKLRPSLEEYLRHENYRYAETSIVNDDKGGIFAVDLSSAR